MVDLAGDTHRAVYTLSFVDAVYVLHVFQMKSKRWMKTPQKDLDLSSDPVRGRLRGASSDRLFRFLNALGQDVKIMIAPRPPRSRRLGSLRVVETTLGPPQPALVPASR